MKEKMVFKSVVLFLSLGIILVLFLVLRPKGDAVADSVFVAESTTAATVTASVTQATEATTTTVTQPVETTTASSYTDLSEETSATNSAADTTTAPITTAKPTGTQIKTFTLADGQVLKDLVFPLEKPDMSNDWVMAHREMFLSEWGYLRSVSLFDNSTGLHLKDPFGMDMVVYFPTETDEINFMTWAKTYNDVPVSYWDTQQWGYVDQSLWSATDDFEFAYANTGKCLPYTAYDQYGNYFGPEVFQQTVNHTRG